MLPFAKGISAKAFDFDSEGSETRFDYYRLMKMIKDSGFNGFVGVEYEGDRLGEEDGIIAINELLLKVAKELN